MSIKLIKMFNLYNKGHITETEFAYSFLRCVREDNVNPLLDWLPPHMRELVVNRAENLRGAESLKTFSIQSVVFVDGYDSAQADRRLAAECRDMLLGAGVVRRYVAGMN